MRSSTALVITDDESLLMGIRQILTEHNIEINESEEWEGPYLGEENISYFIIDESILETANDIRIPQTSALIGLVRKRSFESARQWMKLGAKEIIIVPDEIEQLNAALQKNTPHLLGQDHDSADDYLAFEGAGKVRAFYSAKGGTGKTLIASMVSQNLQIQCNKSVILIDLNVQFGGVEVVFGIEPQRSYIDLLPVIEELSVSHVHNVAVKEENTGIHVLLSPSNPEQTEMVTDQLITRIIRTCRNYFDEVVLDLPSGFTSITFTALNEATHIYYLLNPDSLSVRSLKHTINQFRRYQIGNRDNLFLIINRKNIKSELTEKNIEHLTDLPIAGSIRADFYGVQPYLNMGKPFYQKKNDKGASKTAQDVKTMVKKSIVKGG